MTKSKHFALAMSRAKYLSKNPNKRSVKTWAAHMRAHLSSSEETKP